MGFGQLGFQGGPADITPNFDRLAQRGARLTQFYAQATCTPTRAALLTGRYRQRYAARHEKEQHYYGCVTALDEQMGRLRGELKSLGVAENTLLWFVSDNGPEGKADQAPGSAGPFKGRKRDLWEGDIRVPGIFEYPAVIKTPRVIDTPCVTSDFFPTVLDLVGLSIDGPGPLDGVSLRPLIEGHITERAQGIGFEYDKMAAWIDNQYKLVALLKPAAATDTAKNGSYHESSPQESAAHENGTLSPGGPGAKRKRQQGKVKPSAPQAIAPATQLLLFDLTADPREEHDLAARFPERVQKISAELAA